MNTYEWMNEYYYNGGAGAVSGDGEFVILGLPVFLRHLNASFDIILAYTRLSSVDIYTGPVQKVRIVVPAVEFKSFRY